MSPLFYAVGASGIADANTFCAAKLQIFFNIYKYFAQKKQNFLIL